MYYNVQYCNVMETQAKIFFIIKGGKYDARGYYMSFLNGEWILREEQCN
jgi:hypothetical protein